MNCPHCGTSFHVTRKPDPGELIWCAGCFEASQLALGGTVAIQRDALLPAARKEIEDQRRRVALYRSRGDAEWVDGRGGIEMLLPNTGERRDDLALAVVEPAEGSYRWSTLVGNRQSDVLPSRAAAKRAAIDALAEAFGSGIA